MILWSFSSSIIALSPAFSTIVTVSPVYLELMRCAPNALERIISCLKEQNALSSLGPISTGECRSHRSATLKPGLFVACDAAEGVYRQAVTLVSAA
jgi:hypothetical protein